MKAYSNYENPKSLMYIWQVSTLPFDLKNLKVLAVSIVELFKWLLILICCCWYSVDVTDATAA